jgi:hypothetical protein
MGFYLYLEHRAAMVAAENAAAAPAASVREIQTTPAEIDAAREARLRVIERYERRALGFR